MSFTQKQVDQITELLESMLLTLSLFTRVKLRLRYAGKMSDNVPHEWWFWNDHVARSYGGGPEYVSLHVATVRIYSDGKFYAGFHLSPDPNFYYYYKPVFIDGNGYDELVNAMGDIYNNLFAQESKRRVVL